jgi:hypothetical protein
MFKVIHKIKVSGKGFGGESLFNQRSLRTTYEVDV